MPFYGEPIVTIIDTHRVNDSDPPSLYLALEPDPLYGTVGTTAFYGRLNNSSYVLIGSAQSATTIGTLNTLFPLTTGLDTTTTISITLDRGLLDPLTNEEFADDQLILLIEDEHISVKNAVLTSELTYDVSHFRRGHNGTIPVSHPIGSRVTVLNGKGKAIRINGSASNIGSVLDVKAIPQGQSLDTIVAVYSATIEGLYFKPYAPTNATATVNQSNNISISFTANNTGLSPLSPQSFEIEVYDGVTLVRTISASSIPVKYLVSEQITDFGAVQSSLDLVIYQLSSEYGRGYPLTVTVVPTPVVELPVISTFSPLQGDIGAAISIYGEGFTGATSAAINGTDLTSFTVVNDTTITGVVAALTSTGKVSVTNSAGTTQSIGDFVIFIPSINWGDIGGTLSDQTDLQSGLDAKMTILDYDSDVSGVVDLAENIEGANTAGNDKYYGTNDTGTPGFYDIPQPEKTKNIESISTTKTLLLTSEYFQFLTPTVASVIVKLPSVTGSDYFECEIANQSTTNALAIQENDGTAIVTLANTGDKVRSIYAYWDGTTWQVWIRGYY